MNSCPGRYLAGLCVLLLLFCSSSAYAVKATIVNGEINLDRQNDLREATVGSWHEFTLTVTPTNGTLDEIHIHNPFIGNQLIAFECSINNNMKALKH